MVMTSKKTNKKQLLKKIIIALVLAITLSSALPASFTEDVKEQTIMSCICSPANCIAEEKGKDIIGYT